LANEAQRSVLDFRSEVMIDKLISFYEKVISSGKRQEQLEA